MKLSDTQLKKLRDYFSKQPDVVLVYLYGSFSKGETHKRSDIDFGVLFNPPIKTYYRLGEIINDLSNLGLPAEADVRDIDLNASPVYLRNVVEGKIIYSSNETKRIRFEVAAMRIFRDTEHLRQIKYEYMKKSFKEGTYGFRQDYII